MMWLKVTGKQVKRKVKEWKELNNCQGIKFIS